MRSFFADRMQLGALVCKERCLKVVRSRVRARPHRGEKTPEQAPGVSLDRFFDESIEIVWSQPYVLKLDQSSVSEPSTWRPTWFS